MAGRIVAQRQRPFVPNLLTSKSSDSREVLGGYKNGRVGQEADLRAWHLNAAADP